MLPTHMFAGDREQLVEDIQASKRTVSKTGIAMLICAPLSLAGAVLVGVLGRKLTY